MTTRLAHRPDLREHLDAPAPDPATLARNLRDIRQFNRWLGWTGATVREVAALARCGRWREATLFDVATGSADIPLALAAWARRRGLRLRIVGADLSLPVLAAARRQVGDTPTLALLRCDALRLPCADRGVDIVTCSLALHHFPPEEAVALLRELGRVARRALVVSDLERCWPGYLGARLLAFGLRNPMTRHDAPVSVRRAYTPEELRGLAAAAGLRGARVARRFPFRLVLVWEIED